MQITKVRNFKAGYQIRYEQLTAEEAGVEGGMELKSAYTPEGHYIGSSRWAYRLTVKMGIKPEIRQILNNMDANGGRGYPCSIGFCERAQVWYGWSYRAISSFGIGHRVKKGDVGYVPATMDELYADCLKEGHAPEDILRDPLGVGVTIRHHMVACDEDPVTGAVEVTGQAAPEYQHVDLGRGEWTAETLEDCKQMAIDFAEGVS